MGRESHERGAWRTMRVVSVDEMRAIERRADEEYGLDSPTLMRQAGHSVAEALRERMGGDVRGLRVVTLAGPGNNGGDGLVMNQFLVEWGAQVTTWRWRENTLANEEGETPAGDDLAELRAALARADVVTDALLGTGHARPLDPRMRQALALAGDIRERQALHAPPGRPRPLILAVDLPSGLDADTGAVDEGTLAADLTVTLAFAKTGMTLFPGAGYLGELVVGSIGLPNELAIPAGLEMLTAEEARTLLPARLADSNKGTYGKVMVFAGSPQFIGAAALVGAAAGRVGAGLVTIATTAERARVYASTLPEVTYLLFSEDDSPTERAAALLAALRGYDALVVGPGLSQAPGMKPTLLALFAGLRALPTENRPRLLVDADGLNSLAKESRWWKLLPARTVITPHPAELARLRGGERVSSGAADRLAVAAEVAREWNLTVVLKGACPLIASPDGALRVNLSPNPALATAGTGDVLSGVIGGLMAQGRPPWEAASLGVYLHGLAGARVRARLGEAGAIAPDLIPELPLTIRQTRGAC